MLIFKLYDLKIKRYADILTILYTICQRVVKMPSTNVYFLISMLVVLPHDYRLIEHNLRIIIFCIIVFFFPKAPGQRMVRKISTKSCEIRKNSKSLLGQ